MNIHTTNSRSNIHPVDAIVGNNIRQQRIMRRISQDALAKSLGVTFQQVQKYEKATNRVSASKLAEIAKYLGVTVAELYRGVDGAGAAPFYEETPVDDMESKLIREYRRLNDIQRAKTLEIVRVIAG